MQRLKSRGHVDVIALTPTAASALALTTQECMIDRSEKIFRQFWKPGAFFVVIGAIGAVVRSIAPLIADKSNDPAVLVIDSQARNVVPILGGHKGGCEEFGCDLAQDLGSDFVFTGLSRTENKLAIDSFGQAWGWKRQGTDDQWKKLMIKLANQSPIIFDQSSGSDLWKDSKGAKNIFSLGNKSDILEKELSIKICSESYQNCCWHPATLWIGIGCERGISLNLLERSISQALDEAGLAKESIAGLATIDIKSDEMALKAFQDSHKTPIRFYKSKELLEVHVPTPSKVVLSEVGTPSVAEAAALLASGENGKLRFSKHVYKSKANEKGAVTVAIAESVLPFCPERGELHLVGSGPGDLGYLTHDSRFALSRSVIWIGYKRYLDLLEPLRRFDQVRIDSCLTDERDRCRTALKLAMQGIRVALISSGDSGIYGMAGLALELWLDKNESDRPDFKVHPGISALQIAAAKIGAPLMNDFCAISLSDCLISWEKIEARIRAAAISDFVIAFYNPRSLKRNWQLQKAFEILLQARPENTPVVFGHQLGRSQEMVKVHMLGSFPFEQVDMLSLVLVGNTTSIFKEEYVLTPRGY